MVKRVLVAVAAMVALMSCETTDETYVKDGVNYAETEGVFRGRWWSYYERGANLHRGAFHEAAEADFRRALDGRSRDSWRARTYGLHFTEYFPNRELGIVLYKQGELAEAESYLERSLEHVDTARAHAYLDEVKRKQIETGAIEDTQAPQIAATVPEGVPFANFDIPVEVEARDDSGVDEVRVNGERFYQRGSAEVISHKKQLTLAEGTHEVIVEAGDLAAKASREVKRVTVDLTGPTIGVREPQEAMVTQAASVRLQGSTVDKHGVAEVRLGDRVIAEAQGGTDRLPFDTQVPLQDGENTFILAARDVAGNETFSALNVYKGEAGSSAALLWRIEQKAPDMLQMASANLSPSALLAILQSVEAMQDEQEVQIKLKSPEADRPWRNQRAIRVAGKVLANTQVANLVINGQTVDQLTGEPEESFNRRIVLNEEEFQDGTANVEVAVVADDTEGNQAREEVDVEVVPPDIDTRESRMKLAVLGFGGAVPEQLRSELRTFTENSIFQTDRFNILERQELAAVLSEQQLSDALASPEAALELGNVIPAHVFIVADVISREPEAEVIVRVVSTETTEIMTTIDAHIENTAQLDSMRAGAEDVAIQLENTFPRIGGEILGVRGDTVLVNWGAEDGIMEGMRLLVVFQEEPWIDEETGEVLAEGQTVPIGQARISNVRATNTMAEKVEAEDIEEEGEFDSGMATITM